MRKINYIVIGIIFMILIPIIHAGYQDSQVSVQMMNNRYANVTLGNRYFWNQLGYVYVNGNLSYCIEPGIGITDHVYDSYLDFQIHGLSEEQKNKLELISYYGYQYSNHQTDSYYMATQQLIWESMGYQGVYFTTGAVHGGDRISVESEKAEISRLISVHGLQPSFHNQQVSGIIGEEVVIQDTNQVLSGYRIKGENQDGVKISGNTIKVNPSKVGKIEINLEKIINTNQTSFVYKKSGSQTLANFGLAGKIESKVSLNVEGGRIKLYKVDADSGKNEPSGEGTLSGAIYEVLKDSKKVDELITDENGISVSKPLPFGTYEIVEKTASNGYLIDANRYSVILNKTDVNLIKEITVKEKIIENKIEFTKVFASDVTGALKPEVSISFGIYSKDNILLKEVTTDTDGYAEVVLPFGRYTVKQLTVTEGYEKVKDFEIIINEIKAKPIKYVLSDALISSKLKIKKVDGETLLSVEQKGIQFRIKSLTTGSYITHEINYPAYQKIDMFETNEKGEVLLPEELTVGDYLLEEIKAPIGYVLPKEGIPFKVDEVHIKSTDEVDKLIEVIVPNLKPTIRIEIEKTGETDDIGSAAIYLPLPNVKYQFIAGESMTIKNHPYQNGEIIDTYTTGEDGTITITDYPLGRYCLKEIEAPNGYLIDEKQHCETFSYQDQLTPVIKKEFHFKNKRQKRNLYFEKIGEKLVGIEHNEGIYKELSLENITFGVYAKEDILQNNKVVFKKEEEIERVVTDVSGIGTLKVNLPVGSYYLKEIITASGYQKSNEKYPFIITEETPLEYRVVEKPIKNSLKKENLSILKRDGDTKNVLSGATFSLELENQKQYTGITNAYGVIELKNLPFGTYYLRETKAPKGYLLDKKVNEIKLNQENGNKIVTIENQKITMPQTSNHQLPLIFTIVAFLIIGILVTIISRFVIYKQNE